MPTQVTAIGKNDNLVAKWVRERNLNSIKKTKISL